jgi:hypothetical protein
MNPIVKTLLLVLVTVLSVFAVPAVLIIFYNYLNIFFAITLFVTCFVLFGYCSYREFLPEIQRKHLEDEEIFHQFHGDKDKIRYYKGFKKHFDGELDIEGLERWFKRHPGKH